MKRILFATLLVYALSPAQAGDLPAPTNGTLICGLKDEKGLLLSWAFQNGPDEESVVEIKSARGEAVTAHAPKDRPLWTVTPSNGVAYFVYDKDPRFAIGMSLQLEDTPNMVVGKAALYREQTLLAKGTCGYWKKEANRG